MNTTMNPMPSFIYESVNAAFAQMAMLLLCFTVYYLVIEYRYLPPFYTVMQKARDFVQNKRLSLGVAIFFLFEGLRAVWFWYARYLDNIGEPSAWLGRMPWIAIPIAFSAACIFGMACIIRAITPQAWGRFAYITSLIVVGIGTALARVVRVLVIFGFEVSPVVWVPVFDVFAFVAAVLVMQRLRCAGRSV